MSKSLLAVAALVISLLIAPTAAARATAAPSLPAGLPAGVPAAATAPEPVIPAPQGWPFPNTFSRTSGTGRLGGGASFWTDWVYDDRGASNVAGFPLNVTSNQVGDSLAPAQGSYTYSAANAHNNGADIFRSAVGLDAKNSYWRVDWNTLTDATVPIAEWTFDTDSNSATGASTWPAAAGVASPGIEKALVVSSRGASLIDAVSGLTLTTFPTSVDMSARTFIVAVPRAVLPVSGTWKVRLGAGLADATGTTFAPTSGTARLYNVTFRTVAQEPPVYTDGMTDALIASLQARAATTPVLQQLGADGTGRLVTGNFWGEDDQADTLAGGDVSKFALPVTWSDLAAKDATPEPLVRGYSMRWYVTDLNLGDGIVVNSGSPAGDTKPNYLGRVQPYSVYVPTSYSTGSYAGASSLTWIEHSLSVNYNQYGALDPLQIQQECEQRKSICATTEGFGPDGWYQDEAQHDFFQVWRQLALSYRLDPERTVMTGYSMGGHASYLITMLYPDLFAAAMPLAGPRACGFYIAGPVGGNPGSSPHCTSDSNTLPLVANATYVPYTIADGVLDELVPYTSVQEQIDAFDAAGLRYHFLSYPLEDHLAFAAQDRFGPPIALLGNPTRVTNPGAIHYSWYPDAFTGSLGLGPTTVYWLSGLAARTTAAGTIANVSAVDGARPEPVHTVVKTTTPVASVPAYVQTDSTWQNGATPAATATLALTLTDVCALTLDAPRARLPHATASVTSDGTATLRIAGLAPGTAVSGGTATAYASSAGLAVVSLPLGASTLTW